MREKYVYGYGPHGFHRIAYTEWGAPSSQPPVICVHGLIRNGRDFDYLSLALEGEGRQMFCPDIVGRGKSDWLANPDNYNYVQYIADLTALIARTGAAWGRFRRSPCANRAGNDPTRAACRTGRVSEDRPRAGAYGFDPDCDYRRVLAPCLA
jgi:hypothetical protein